MISAPDTTDERERPNGQGPKDALPETPWAMDADELARELASDAEHGLDEAEAKQRRRRFGPNQLRETKPKSALAILVDQFANLLVGLLSIAALAALIFGKWIEGIAIGIALVLNAVVGFFTELKATRSMEALRKLGETEAKARRAGETRVLPADQLVPGDLVILEAGDLVPADLRLVEANNLQADESALTGESTTVTKQLESLDADTSLAERSCMLFKGTAVTAGSGAGIAVATGMQTELGSIAELAEEAGEEFTPLEKRLERLARRLIWATLAVGVLVATAGIIGGKDLLLVLETAIAMAVAAVPEGLPIVATIALARGMWRMAHHKAVINRLSSVETLGATTVICTDKTGTLTENRMHLKRLETAAGDIDPEAEEQDEAGKTLLKRALEIGILCNNASLTDDESGVGEPMEIAFLQAGRERDLSREQLLEQMPEAREEAFSAETMMMATFHETEEGYRVAVKGAPEAVLDHCTRIAATDGNDELDDEQRATWRDKNRQMAETGLRVLTLAEKTVSSQEADPYRDLTLIGLAGLWDPPREAVKESLDDCRQAGIRVIMVTGDHPATARTIAEAVGLEIGEEEDLTGEALQPADQLDEGQRRQILGTAIFARVSPEQKLTLIDLHQQQGEIVAMTGDGVNDAPALQKADIGIAMGRRGTQVAREAADMVLRDDEFSTIVTAIYHGRVIFNNIRKFIFFLLSGNVSEILIITLAAMVNAPLPLLPLQILYLNLIGDVFPALALGVGEGDKSVMQKPPRDPEEPVLTKAYWLATVGYALMIAAAVLAAFAAALLYYDLPQQQAVTISFLALSLARLTHVFNMRDLDSPPLVNEITRNPYIWGALAICLALLAGALYLPLLRGILDLTAPGREGWLLILLVALVPLVTGQVAKQIRAKTQH